MDENYKEVLYSEYCNRCIHKDEDEAADKCHECLEECARQYSHKPLNFISRE